MVDDIFHVRTKKDDRPLLTVWLSDGQVVDAIQHRYLDVENKPLVLMHTRITDKLSTGGFMRAVQMFGKSIDPATINPILQRTIMERYQCLSSTQPTDASPPEKTLYDGCETTVTSPSAREEKVPF